MSPRGRGPALAIFAAILLLGSAARGESEPKGSPAGREALETCVAVDDAPAAAKDRSLDLALSQAEEAVKANEDDPVAHFALFCSLGKRAKRDGIAVQSLAAVRRMRREVDRALELAPSYPDALVGKGAFLLQLPRVLGGDRVEGERLLRIALAARPDWLDARLQLARGLAGYGERAAALAEARRALALAEEQGERAKAEEARKLVTDLER